MTTQLLGIHHVTAIVGEPQENIDFYTSVLGLRLVKQTVNFDDPYTYHLYYGDETGQPGTIITFFPWPASRHGSSGTGQISAIQFAVPVGALPFWQARLVDFGWRYGGPETRNDAAVLQFYDPAGLLLELVETPGEAHRSASGDIPAAAAIQRLAGVTLTVAQSAPSAAFLAELLHFRADAGANTLVLDDGANAARVTLVERPNVPRGSIAAGSVHHVAWRVPDAAALEAWRQALLSQGVGVTEIRERKYFQSIYFREPGGVLFEIATDAPGFAVDEPAATLGTQLQLPPWLEAQRDEIARRLPPIVLPAAPIG